MNRPKTAQEIHETLYDGVDAKVSLKDGSERVVKIRKINRREFASYATSLGNEEAEVIFYLGDPALAAALDDDGFEKVMEEGHRLNFSRFNSWFRRQTDLLTLMDGNKAFAQAMTAAIQTSPELKKLLGST